MRLIPSVALPMLLATPVLAQDAQYELVNATALTVMEFYTSPASLDEWGDDILGANVVPAGEAGTVTIANGSAQCAYDLRFVFEDGQELTDSVDICSTPRYTLSQ